MPNILDPKFKYVPAAKTDIAKTFERVRREMKKAEEDRRAEELTQISKVHSIGSARK